jgi:hypothetical protein
MHGMLPPSRQDTFGPSFSLDVRELDHLSPFVSLGGEEFAEIGGGAGTRYVSMADMQQAMSSDAMGYAEIQ